MTRYPAEPRNIPGVVGLCLVLLAAVLSPTGFLVITLPFLVLLGFGGLVVCGISLARRPRWPGVVGLTVGTLCIAAWVGFFSLVYMHVQRNAAALGLNIGQHGQMCMSAMALVETAEAQRTPTGAAAQRVEIAGAVAAYGNDPWGRAYRYVLVNTPRGYTFMSDGPDGVGNTADDIDILTIQRDGLFMLPPPPGPPATTPATGGAESAQGGR
jgi:hypothetical protein